MCIRDSFYHLHKRTAKSFNGTMKMRSMFRGWAARDLSAFDSCSQSWPFCQVNVGMRARPMQAWLSAPKTPKNQLWKVWKVLRMVHGALQFRKASVAFARASVLRAGLAHARRQVLVNFNMFKAPTRAGALSACISAL
eukprot:10731411-Alexandrium_andersonii.AAC.1